MQPLDRVSVAVDLGPNTDGVVEAAAKLASQFQATVRLLFVLEEVPHYLTVLELIKKEAGDRLESIHGALVARGVSCEPPMQVVGKPFDSIVRTADSVKAHLIVLGHVPGCDRTF